MSSLKYLYKINDNINGLIILEQNFITCINKKTGNKRKYKSYKYKCEKCGYIGEKFEDNFKKGTGCLLCTNQTVVKGINDIATTNPDLVKYFPNKELSQCYSYSSNKKILLTCPECGQGKFTSPNQIYRYGFCCSACSDGISYPEKYIYSLLSQLNLRFKRELRNSDFEWCDEYRYDYYLYDSNDVIECHGLQHYEQSNRGRLLEDEQSIDKAKELLALQYVNDYIVLDCRYSDSDYIKKSILNSNLNKFDLSNINWNQCHEFAVDSLVKVSCDLFNSGKNTIEIGKILSLHYTTIIKYLKQGHKIGWCIYDGKSELQKGRDKSIKTNSKKIIVLEDGKEFNSRQELVDKSLKIYGVKFTASMITGVCNGKYTNHKGYHFKYATKK